MGLGYVDDHVEDLVEQTQRSEHLENVLSGHSLKHLISTSNELFALNIYWVFLRQIYYLLKYS